MSSLSLVTNVLSLRAQRNLSLTSKNLETSFARLSSGLRINRASDDAAGLSISSLLEADRRVLTQGIRNYNDGISYLNIAESAVSELTNILFRIQEISEQSANGTLSDTQRKPLQAEVSALQSEYNRIISTTKFNDTQLLTGDNTTVSLQAGYGSDGSLTVQVGNVLRNDTFGVQSAGETTRVSTSGSGGEANAASWIGSISADGWFLAFGSSASNLIAGVSGSQSYVKDLQTGVLTLASSSASGTQGNGTSSTGRISADGKYLAFISDSTNLISGVSGGQVYLKDLQTGAVSLASSSSSGTQGNGTSQDMQISADGRYLSFQGTSTNLIPGVSGTQLYVKDLQTGLLNLASSAATGTQGDQPSYLMGTSANGRFLVFQSNSTNLVPGVSGGQVYVKDLQTGGVTLASSSASGDEGISLSTQASISADGRYVSFFSTASNLIAGVSGNQTYIKDLQTGGLTLGSTSSTGTQGNGSSGLGRLSADGRFLSFYSDSSNLISGISGGQVYRKDLSNGVLELVTRSTTGTTSTASYGPNQITADGSKVFFMSASASFTAGDTNGVQDLFSRDLSKAGIDDLAGMVVSNQVSARTTLALAKQRLEILGLAQAGIGASTSRIGTAVSNLSTVTQNLATAASQIMDVDIADESTRLVANRILQQAGASVLSLANAQPELVIRMLRDV